MIINKEGPESGGSKAKAQKRGSGKGRRIVLCSISYQENGFVFFYEPLEIGPPKSIMPRPKNAGLSRILVGIPGCRRHHPLSNRFQCRSGSQPCGGYGRQGTPWERPTITAFTIDHVGAGGASWWHEKWCKCPTVLPTVGGWWSRGTSYMAQVYSLSGYHLVL